MLKQRIITAVLLLMVLLPALLYPDVRIFLGLTVLAISAAAWEWGRLCGLGSNAARGAALVCAGLCLATWAMGLVSSPVPQVWLLGGLAWLLGSAWLLRAGVLRWQALALSLRYTVGLAGLWLAWLALAQARQLGVNFLLSSMTLVWAADIGAYFAGKRWGTRVIAQRLAPSISPGKSWEGVAGGAVAVLLLALVWVAFEQRGQADGTSSLYSVLWRRGPVVFVLGLALMVAMSVVGDLVESLVKRAAGVKDSSQLLPGHGGVLDRVDALLPTLPLAMCLYALIQLEAVR